MGCIQSCCKSDEEVLTPILQNHPNARVSQRPPPTIINSSQNSHHVLPRVRNSSRLKGTRRVQTPVLRQTDQPRQNNLSRRAASTRSLGQMKQSQAPVLIQTDTAASIQNVLVSENDLVSSRSERSQHNPSIFDISSDPFYDPYRTVTFELMETDSKQYFQTAKRIPRDKFQIDAIMKVKNPYLKQAYLLKREQKRLWFPNVEEKLLFHGTTLENIHPICLMNFNWRLSKRYQFGKAVYFCPSFNHASNYSEENEDRYMFLAKVLVTKTSTGNYEMVLTDECDKSQKGDGISIAKYEDNEFYPFFIIKYKFLNTNYYSESE